ncbi:MAG: CPBP family intramembrane metalloprotease [Chloroflexi bacterium]|jgi:membrane protease YdiL (CAAX protease family)|nr:CPBP family intramembrane metalloprotease [Chloroflexota bacterium]
MELEEINNLASSDSTAWNKVEEANQYSLAKILGIWAAAVLPMVTLSWIVFPAVSPDFKTDPLGAGLTRFVLLTVGLIWLFVLSMIIVYREEGDLRWGTIRQRLWLNTPRDPKTGQPRGRLWLWLIPFIILGIAYGIYLTPVIDRMWVSIFPFFSEPPGFGGGAFLESPEIQVQLVGAWWFFLLYFVSALFNTVLGEEFLFRGVLLPKMNGVFGKWDWVANGTLFGLYHLHQPWSILASIIDGILLFALPSRVFRSTWMAIILHSLQSVFFLFLILGIILGLA